MLDRPLHQPIQQRAYHPADALPADPSIPATVMVAPQRRVALAPVIAFDVDPRVRDEADERRRHLPEEGLYPSPALWCSQVPGAVLAGDRAVVIAGDEWLADTARAARLVGGVELADGDALRVPPVEAEEDLDAVLVSYAAGVPFNYYHWLFEGLSRLFVAEAAGVDLATARFVVAHDLAPVELESLAVAGVREDQLVRWSGAPTRWRSLVVPSRGLRSAATMTALAVNGLRRMARRLEPAADAPPAPRRIFLSRADAPRRRTRNEDELRAVAERAGFVTIGTEARSFADQVRLFRDAEIIVGPHGAGFTNCAFAPAGATLVELFGEQMPQPLLYRHMVSCRGHRYAFCVGPRSPGQRRTGWMAADFEVDPKRFAHVLGRVVEELENRTCIER